MMSGMRTLSGVRRMSTGAKSTSPRSPAVTCRSRSRNKALLTIWCIGAGDGVTTNSPLMISCRSPGCSSGIDSKSSYVRRVTIAMSCPSLVAGALAFDAGQTQRRAQEHVGPRFQVFGGGVLLLAVAESVDGAGEDHRARRDLLDVLRVMTGPRPAPARGDAHLLRRRLNGFHDVGRKGRRLAGPEAVDSDAHPGLSRDVARQALQPGNESVE